MELNCRMAQSPAVLVFVRQSRLAETALGVEATSTLLKWLSDPE